jgi:hypothetical protein
MEAPDAKKVCFLERLKRKVAICACGFAIYACLSVWYSLFKVNMQDPVD